MNKRGWIRIVEAFFALLLVAGALLIVLNKGYIGKEDISARVYDLQLSVLREIELDDPLRLKILTAEREGCAGICTDPIPLEDGESGFPQDVQNKINNRMTEAFTCRSKICELNDYIDTDVYAQPVAITATLTEYSPRQLKIFCWVV